ncbi:MAG: signal peptide peptidase SppA [Ignavibacteriae bacterium]|nr:signal peptide peptidase SppA [Ignavibacteriota bacterium]
MSKSTKWFLVILGIVLVTGLLITVVFVSMIGNLGGGGTETVTTGSGDKIGVVELQGVITSSEDFVRQVKKFREQSSIRAILIRIDSPGGGVVASQEMYEEVRKTRESGKPVVVSMGSLAASGGYYVACGASRLVANRGTLTGSIGVISEFLQMHELLGKVGVDIKTIKAGALKDAGSSSRPMTEKDQKYFQALMDDVHRQFITVVADERGFDSAYASELADGRVFTGEQAVVAGLVDTIGTYEDAIQITAEIAGIEGEPSLVREKKRRTWLESMTGDVTEQVRAATQEMLSWPVMSFRFTGR